jgi:hypothetical protein
MNESRDLAREESLGSICDAIVHGCPMTMIRYSKQYRLLEDRPLIC